MTRLSPLLGESAAIEELRDFIVGVSLLSSPVLLSGDRGTGKTLAARKIHAVGSFASSPFVALDCAQLDDRELDRILFDPAGDGERTGVLRGSFGTTCYLANIEALGASLERQLLRHLLSTPRDEEFGPRLLCGSTRHYEELVQGRYVEPALLDAIARYRLRIPPLRERTEDIAILCHYQIWLHSRGDEYEQSWERFRLEVLPHLLDHPWPGNVSELIELSRHFCRLGSCSVAELLARAEPGAESPGEYLRRVLEQLYSELLVQLERAGVDGRGGSLDLSNDGERTSIHAGEHTS